MQSPCLKKKVEYLGSHCRVCALPPLSRPDADACVDGGHDLVGGLLEDDAGNGAFSQGCQMAKFDPFLSLDCARVEGVGAQSKERKGSKFAA